MTKGMDMPTTQTIGELEDQCFNYFADCAAVWEEPFLAGPGLVMSVKDAAVLMAEYIKKYAGGYFPNDD